MYLVSSLFLGERSVQKLREEEEESLNLCTEQSPKESDDTRWCKVKFDLLRMSIILLEAGRGM